MSQTKYCEKCKGDRLYSKDWYMEKSCPCHQPKPEVFEHKVDCATNAAEVADEFAAMGCTCKPSPASTEEWEKDFDDFWWQEFETDPKIDAEGIKKFIRSHDQQLRQRIVAGISEKADEYINQCASRIPSAEPTIRGFVEYLNPPVSTNLK